MKVLYFIIVLFLFGIKSNKNHSNFELQILDKYLINGKCVNVILKNNSQSNYCFVMDTVYYERDRPGFEITIRNTKVILLDSKNFEVPLLRDVYLHDIDSNSILKNEIYLKKQTWVNPFRILTVKAGKSIKLRVPFDLIIKYKFLSETAVFQIDKNKRYLGRVEYMIQKNYIEKYISKQKIDSLNKKGYKFFVGSLKSNRVPLVIEK
ncbi:hypothetical protein [Flavobacterium aquicola]|uniref:Uncharacterized protein n=1 Tax=Flavobacterium aquicola TaxID=1682742 RepID=A0A3E0ELJ3_9FLAO|nr:hypothetical protein [Flavobacterium aquicola]REG97996.1 hypothetical protein C8P67_108162 [Flavobacterium aquicola]